VAGKLVGFHESSDVQVSPSEFSTTETLLVKDSLSSCTY
jgi:hypothetical protein